MSPLIQDLARVLPARQVVTDDLRRLAYGTDASFYRLIPEVVAIVENESEVQAVLRAADEDLETNPLNAALPSSGTGARGAHERRNRRSRRLAILIGHVSGPAEADGPLARPGLN